MQAATSSSRLLAAALMLGLFGGTQAVRAQDEGGEQDTVDNEFGVGLYLGNCDSLVAGAALYDLGDVELETESFENQDENAGSADEEEGPDLEEELEEESSGDETDVEAAIGEEGSGEASGESSDEEVVIQGDVIPVYISTGDAFGASLVDLVDAPFAVAVRESSQDEAETEGAEEGNDGFIACGEFGGAVAGDEIVIPLQALGEGGFTGIAILSQGEEESVASVYLFGQATAMDDSGDESEEDAAAGEDASAEEDAEGVFATPTS